MKLKEVMPEPLSKRLAAGETIAMVDVREAGELELVPMLEGSVHIPLRQLAQRANELNPDLTTVVICHHGRRSLAGAMVLMQQDFNDVASLRGGVELWALTVDPSIGRY